MGGPAAVCKQLEPMPASKAGFKRNRSYVLESQLLQHEVVHPPTACPAGLFQGQEKVWNRKHIAALKSDVQWRREGRSVISGEQACKTLLKSQHRLPVALYGLWQTEPVPISEETVDDTPEPAGGAIPGTNNYGNLEFLPGSAVQLPRGTVHIVVNEARAAAIRLGVPFAPVVVGFHREHGQVKPKYGGAVVWKRDEDAVLEGIAVEKERLQEIAEKLKAERMEAAWRLLVKSILVDRYVESNYGNSLA
mmetsp:Transcript_39805/g.89207  ORF Transcript_39805/g.89207 Transcript_39805/m.89207 type:complete len:249 (+) Transcript_39805:66-812(+)